MYRNDRSRYAILATQLEKEQLRAHAAAHIKGFLRARRTIWALRKERHEAKLRFAEHEREAFQRYETPASTAIVKQPQAGGTPSRPPPITATTSGGYPASGRSTPPPVERVKFVDDAEVVASVSKGPSQANSVTNSPASHKLTGPDAEMERILRELENFEERLENIGASSSPTVKREEFDSCTRCFSVLIQSVVKCRRQMMLTGTPRTLSMQREGSSVASPASSVFSVDGVSPAGKDAQSEPTPPPLTGDAFGESPAAEAATRDTARSITAWRHSTWRLSEDTRVALLADLQRWDDALNVLKRVESRRRRCLSDDSFVDLDEASLEWKAVLLDLQAKQRAALQSEQARQAAEMEASRRRGREATAAAQLSAAEETQKAQRLMQLVELQSRVSSAEIDGRIDIVSQEAEERATRRVEIASMLQEMYEEDKEKAHSVVLDAMGNMFFQRGQELRLVADEEEARTEVIARETAKRQTVRQLMQNDMSTLRLVTKEEPLGRGKLQSAEEIARSVLNDIHQLHLDDTRNRNRAATKIQRLQRSNSSKQKRKEREADRDTAHAQRIEIEEQEWQQEQEAKQAQNQQSHLDAQRRHASATQIQRVARGRQQRQQTKARSLSNHQSINDRVSREERQEIRAAVVIQSWLRCIRARRAFAWKLNKRDILDRRRFVEEERAWMEECEGTVLQEKALEEQFRNQKATVIQKAVRGRQQKKQVESRRAASHALIESRIQGESAALTVEMSAKILIRFMRSSWMKRRFKKQLKIREQVLNQLALFEDALDIALDMGEMQHEELFSRSQMMVKANMAWTRILHEAQQSITKCDVVHKEPHSQREAEQKAAAQREAEQKAAAEKQKAAAHREAEQKAAAQRDAEQKAAAHREAEQKAAAQRDAEQKAAAQRDAEQKAAAQRDAKQKAAAERDAEQKAAAHRRAEELPPTSTTVDSENRNLKQEFESASGHSIPPPLMRPTSARAPNSSRPTTLPPRPFSAAAQRPVTTTAVHLRHLQSPYEDEQLLMKPALRTLTSPWGGGAFAPSPSDDGYIAEDLSASPLLSDGDASPPPPPLPSRSHNNSNNDLSTLGYVQLHHIISRAIRGAFHLPSDGNRNPSNVSITFSDLLDALHGPSSVDFQRRGATSQKDLLVAQVKTKHESIELVEDVADLQIGRKNKQTPKKSVFINPFHDLWTSQDFVNDVVSRLKLLAPSQESVRSHLFRLDEICMAILSSIRDPFQSIVEGDATTVTQTAAAFEKFCDLFVEEGLRAVVAEKRRADSETVAATFAILDIHSHRMIPRKLFESVITLRVALPESVGDGISFLTFCAILRRNRVHTPATCQRFLGRFYQETLFRSAPKHYLDRRVDKVKAVQRRIVEHTTDFLTHLQQQPSAVASKIPFLDSVLLLLVALPLSHRQHLLMLAVGMLQLFYPFFKEKTNTSELYDHFDELLVDAQNIFSGDAAVDQQQQQQKRIDPMLRIATRWARLIEHPEFHEVLRLQSVTLASAGQPNVFQEKTSVTEALDKCVPWSSFPVQQLEVLSLFVELERFEIVSAKLADGLPLDKAGHVSADGKVTLVAPTVLTGRQNASNNGNVVGLAILNSLTETAMRTGTPSTWFIQGVQGRFSQLHTILYDLRHLISCYAEVSSVQMMKRCTASIVNGGIAPLATMSDVALQLQALVEQSQTESSLHCPFFYRESDSADNAEPVFFSQRFSQMMFQLSTCVPSVPATSSSSSLLSSITRPPPSAPAQGKNERESSPTRTPVRPSSGGPSRPTSAVRSSIGTPSLRDYQKPMTPSAVRPVDSTTPAPPSSSTPRPLSSVASPLHKFGQPVVLTSTCAPPKTAFAASPAPGAPSPPAAVQAARANPRLMNLRKL